jgi:16S rRNA (guanine(966)-N(2))-methyltransferase RsmD
MITSDAVRIIGGVLGGRRLRAPRGADTRPTADRVRQALFDVLESSGGLEGARVLDLFAGTGALSFEALSRGAAAALLVDKSAVAVRCIAENAAALGVIDRTRTLRADAHDAVAHFAPPTMGRRFDLVFLDPPYADAEAAAAQLLPALAPHLAGGGRIVFEHDRRLTLADQFGDLRCSDRRRWGDTAVSFYEMSPGLAP